MDIPGKIIFGGHTILVQRHTSYQNERQGYYDVNLDFISVSQDTNISESICAEVFMHELFEMVNCRFQLELPHKTIVCLSECLFSIIRNNHLDFKNGILED